MKYDFAAVEKKWQDIWEKENTFAASNDYTKPKFYALVEFPYPSGQGLHVGHPRSYTALDILAQACAGAGPEGLTIQEFSSGETAYDGDSRLLRKPAQAVCTAYLYAITEADGTFLDFEIRGERIP